MSNPFKLVILIILFSSCNDNTKRKNEITEAIKQINQAIRVNSEIISQRDAAIKNMDQLNSSSKGRYGYDSLVM